MTDIRHPNNCTCGTCEGRLTRDLTQQVREFMQDVEVERLDLSRRRADLVARAISPDLTPEVVRSTLAEIFEFEEPPRWSDLVATARLRQQRIAKLEMRWADSQHHLRTVAEMLHAGDVDHARSHLREVLSPVPGDASASAPANDDADSPASSAEVLEYLDEVDAPSRIVAAVVRLADLQDMSEEDAW